MKLIVSKLFLITGLFLLIVDVKELYAQTVSFDKSVSTVAGSNYGTADGVGTAAQFSTPNAVKIDASGNLYVSDMYSSTIRKIAPDGTVTTYAGKGENGYGFADGPAADAWFNMPYGLAVAPDGTVYVGDSQNNRVRKITPDRMVSTFVGNGSMGQVDGNGTNASFLFPTGLHMDAAGYIYVADQTNHAIRKISPSGDVTTVAGNRLTAGFADGPVASAKFNSPTDVTADAQGNIYVTDSYNHRIRKITPDGTVTTLAGTGTYGYKDGPGATAMFNTPGWLTCDASGNLYVTDNNVIRKITPDGMVTTIAGVPAGGDADGPASEAKFYGPGGITMDADGNFYIADSYNLKIRKLSSASLSTFTSTFGTPSAVQSFKVSGSALTGNLKVTASAGIEVSLTSGSGFASSVDIIPVSGKVSSATVYIRLSSTAAIGAVTGTINISSSGAVSETKAVKGNVAKGTQAITFGALNTKKYGDADFSLNASASSNLSVTYISSNLSVATVSGNTVTIVGIGSANITASQSGNAGYAAAADVVQPLTVTKGLLIAKADDKSKAYNESNPALTISYAGFRTGEGPASITEPTISTTALTNSDPGSYPITLAGGASAKYDITLQQGNLVINKLIQTITFQPIDNRDAGEPSFGLTATASSGLPVSYESSDTAVATVSGTTLTIVGRGTANIIAKQNGNEYYEAAPDVVQPFTVNKLNQIITFDAISDKIYGDASFSPASSSSGLAVSYTSSNTAVARIISNKIVILGAGKTTITAKQAGNVEYGAAADVVQEMTVNKKDQYLIFDPLPAKQMGDSAFYINTNSNSGLTVELLSSDPAVATITGNRVTIVGLGSTVITAKQSGNNNYNAALSLTQTLTIGKGTQKIYFAAIDDKTMNDEIFYLGAQSSADLSVTYTSSDPEVIRIDGNKVTILGTGEVTITAHQEGNGSFNAAPDVERTFSVTTATGNKSAVVQENVKIGPNPASEDIIIFAEESELSQIILFDMSGNKMVTVGNSYIGKNYRLPVQSYEPGFYMLSIETKRGSTINRKILITR